MRVVTKATSSEPRGHFCISGSGLGPGLWPVPCREIAAVILDAFSNPLCAGAGLSFGFLSLLHCQVNGRIISKQIHVRVEHVSPSKCRDELKRRVKENEAAKKAARAGGGLSWRGVVVVDFVVFWRGCLLICPSLTVLCLCFLARRAPSLFAFILRILLQIPTRGAPNY